MTMDDFCGESYVSRLDVRKVYEKIAVAKPKEALKSSKEWVHFYFQS